MNTQNITIGQVTANLIMALRSVEQARNYYYLATEETRGNVADLTNHLTPEEVNAFETASTLVEKMICDNIRLWANSTDTSNEI